MEEDSSVLVTLFNYLSNKRNYCCLYENSSIKVSLEGVRPGDPKWQQKTNFNILKSIRNERVMLEAPGMNCCCLKDGKRTLPMDRPSSNYKANIRIRSCGHKNIKEYRINRHRMGFLSLLTRSL